MLSVVVLPVVGNSVADTAGPEGSSDVREFVGRDVGPAVEAVVGVLVLVGIVDGGSVRTRIRSAGVGDLVGSDTLLLVGLKLCSFVGAEVG